MTSGPTVVNGPLHNGGVDDDRRIVAYFSTVEQARAVVSALTEAGVQSSQINLADATAQSAELRPADTSVIGAIREAILPDDGQRATRDAVASQDVTLTVSPRAADVDRVVAIIQAGKPHHFDAVLERWRNSPPS